MFVKIGIEVLRFILCFIYIAPTASEVALVLMNEIIIT